MVLLTFVLLGIGAPLGLLGVGYLGPIWPLGEGAARVFFIIAYPLLAISLYRTALHDLQLYRQELTGLSNEALRQSQELLFLIEATRSIGDGFDVRALWVRGRQYCEALRADRRVFYSCPRKPGHLNRSRFVPPVGVERKPH
jgi:hypothetical protein